MTEAKERSRLLKIDHTAASQFASCGLKTWSELIESAKNPEQGDDAEAVDAPPTTDVSTTGMQPPTTDVSTTGMQPPLERPTKRSRVAP